MAWIILVQNFTAFLGLLFHFCFFFLFFCFVFCVLIRGNPLGDLEIISYCKHCNYNFPISTISALICFIIYWGYKLFNLHLMEIDYNTMLLSFKQKKRVCVCECMCACAFSTKMTNSLIKLKWNGIGWSGRIHDLVRCILYTACFMSIDSMARTYHSTARTHGAVFESG